MKAIVPALLLALLTPLAAHAGTRPIRVDLTLTDRKASTTPISTSVVCYDGKPAESRTGIGILRVAATIDDQGMITVDFTLIPVGTSEDSNEIHMPTATTFPDQAATVAFDTYFLRLTPSLVLATTFDVDFAGGTLGQLLDTIEKGNNPPFNLIASSDQLKVPVPAFLLRSSGPDTLAALLNRFVTPQGLKVSQISKSASSLNRIRPDLGSVFLLEADADGGRNPASFACFSLAPLLDQYTPEAIAEAIRTAWELDPNRTSTSATLKYHPATKLMFVVDTNESSIAVAKQIYVALGGRNADVEQRLAQAVERIKQRREAGDDIRTDEDPGQRMRQIADEIRQRRDQRRNMMEASTTPEETPSPAP